MLAGIPSVKWRSGDGNLGGPQSVRDATMQGAAAFGNCGVDRGSHVGENGLPLCERKKWQPGRCLGRE